jgi:phage tail-like protein
MPRTTAEDQLQSFRFRVFEVDGGPGVFGDEVPVAGFATITMPEITSEIATYRTGADKHTKKLLGPVEYGEATFTRGLLIGGNTMFNWIQEFYLNKQPFRTDLEVRVYNQEGDGTSPDDQHVKSVVLRECIPTSVKPMGDLDANAADVNMEELTIAVEEMEVGNA